MVVVVERKREGWKRWVESIREDIEGNGKK